MSNQDLQQNILKKAIDFMRSWVTVNWDLVLEPKEPKVSWAGTKQAIVEYEVKDFGENVLFATFMQTAVVGFRLSKNEHGTFIWGADICFRFKEGGGNGWTHPRNFVLKGNDFIEKPR